PGRATPTDGRAHGREQPGGQRLRLRALLGGRTPEPREERVGPMIEGLQRPFALGALLHVGGDSPELRPGEIPQRELLERRSVGAARRLHRRYLAPREPPYSLSRRCISPYYRGEGVR